MPINVQSWNVIIRLNVPTADRSYLMVHDSVDGRKNGNINKQNLPLCHSIVYYYNGAQRYEQFLQIGRLYRALILLGLALCLLSASVSLGPVSKMTYNVMSRTLNSTTPYHTCVFSLNGATLILKIFFAYILLFIF